MNNSTKQIVSILDSVDISSWQKFKFEEIASNISERVEPAISDAEIYVGLEHLDSNSTHIKRHGSPSDVKGTKLKVYKGDVIFGKRRAYQRKAGVADFDGICSAHAMVLRANPGVVDPEFFPFFIHSDTFMGRALEVSEGSLSPTIKWNILKEQYFKIPPLSIQKELLKILSKVDLLIIGYQKSYEDFLTFRLTKINHLMELSKTPRLPLSSLPVFTINGLWKTKEKDSIDVKVIRSTEFAKFGELDFSKIDHIGVSKKQFKNRQLQKRDIILEKSGGSPDQPVGRVAYFYEEENDYSFSNFTSLIRVEDTTKLVPRFLFHYLLNVYENGKTKRMQNQTTGIINLNYDLYSAMEVPLPNIEDQEDIVNEIDDIEVNRHSLENQIKITQDLLAGFINRIL